METELNADTWIWVIVQNPEKKSSFLGQQDTENNVKFITAFLDKESALMSMNLLKKDENADYEPQAVFYEELLTHAHNNKFSIYLLDKKGTILDKISP